MIKKLSFKLLLVFSVLVVSAIITSSCYAVLTEDNFISFDSLNSGITMKDVYSYIESQNSDHYLDDYNLSKFLARFDSSSNIIRFEFFDHADLEYIIVSYLSSGYYRGPGYDSYNNMLTKSGMKIYVYYDLNTRTFSLETASSSANSLFYSGSKNVDSGVVSYLDITSIDIYYENKDTLIHSGDSYSSSSVNFDYSFLGVKRGQVKLTIDNLDSKYKMYGYVDCKNNFSVGDVLDIKSISSYLRFFTSPSFPDSYCYLYEGEKLLYYILDNDNVIIDIGYISELAEGYFLYGFSIDDGVDFVFLNNGQVYWNNDFTFKYQFENGKLLTKNEVVSAGSYTYIISDKTIPNMTYHGYVYDSNNVLICSADAHTSNDLSSFYVQEVTTSYYETHTLIRDQSTYTVQYMTIRGTYSNGDNIDFSNYYLRWSVPTWLTLAGIEIGVESYDKYNGIITGFSDTGVLGIHLKIREWLSDHKKSFDITLEVFDPDGNLVTTYIINSDEIVRNQILSEENNLDKPSYDIVDNPNYSGGSGNKDFTDIQNWKIEDYLKLLTTDNFIWEFFKAVISNLPWWITIPITILIFGVVIITLFRFARGA